MSLVVNPLPSFINAPNPSCWHSCHEGVVFHVFGDDGACCYHGVLADGDAADYGAVGSQRGAFSDQGLLIYSVDGIFRSRHGDVGEHAARSAEDVVFQLYAFVDGYVVLYLNAIAYLDIVADVDVLSEGTVLADGGA